MAQSYSSNSNTWSINPKATQSPVSQTPPTPPAGSYIINPGSVYQTYNPNTNTTTYGNAPAGYAQNVAQGVQAPAVQTPSNLPSTAQVYQGSQGYAPISADTIFKPMTIGGQDVIASNVSAGLTKGDYSVASLPKVPSSLNATTVQSLDNNLNKAVQENQKKLATQTANGGVNLKNPAIAQANPFVQANPNYINALYQEAYGRNATKQEQSQFAGRTVKDASNLILGQGKSPFTNATQTGHPANSVITDQHGSTIKTDEQGVPDVSQSQTFTQQLDQVMKDISTTQANILKAQTDLSQYQADTATGSINIGNELGRPASLIQGEQYSLQLLRQVGEKTMTEKVGYLQQNLANLQQDRQFIWQQSQQLSSNAQSNLNMLLNTLKDSGMKWSDLPASQQKAMSDLATSANVPSNLLASAVNAMALTKANQQALEYAKLDVGNYALNSYTGEIYNKKTGEIIKSSQNNVRATSQAQNTAQNQTGSKTITTPQGSYSIPADGSTGGQCGSYLNGANGIMTGAPAFGDTWQSKADAMNMSTDKYQVGDIIAFKTNLPYGHVAVVTGVDGKNVTVSESNYNLDGKVGTRTISATDKNILGSYRGAKFKNEVQDNTDTQNILAQAGLSIQAFNYLTQGTPSMSRMPAQQRNEIMSEANKWLNNKGIDVSTFQSQYKTYNDVLSSNISRFNKTNIMENEIKGTADNLINVLSQTDLNDLKVENLAKLFAGEQVNDPIVTKYSFHLEQLKNELAGFYAASQGKNSPDLVENEAATETIKNGLSSRSVQSFKDAVVSATSKMNTVLQNSVDAARKNVWDLFGVGDKYKITVSNYEVGKTYSVNGKNYKYIGNDQFEPQ